MFVKFSIKYSHLNFVCNCDHSELASVATRALGSSAVGSGGAVGIRRGHNIAATRCGMLLQTHIRDTADYLTFHADEPTTCAYFPAYV